MAIPVLILGESGSGKTASMRNFEPGEIGVINVAGKPLPFKSKIELFSSDDYMAVDKKISEYVEDGIKVVVVDDSQYLMANEFMRRATETGFQKFTEIGQNYWALINSVKELPDDVIVYFLSHTENLDGNEKVKTIGKLLDEKITIEGMFTIVLKTAVSDGVYTFCTQNNGHDTVKSPMGMFESINVDNDLKFIDEKIRNYYEIGDFKEVVEDKPVELPTKKRRSATSAAEEKPKRKRRSATRKEVEVVDDELPAETELPEVEEVELEMPKRKRRRKSE